MNPDLRLEDRVVMFTDVHHFTLAAQAMPEHPAYFLQKMYAVLGDIIVAHQGEIVKYLGDAMLCIFPRQCAQEAVECSLKMRKAFAALVTQNGLPPETELEIGLGLGAVAIGTFGHRTLRIKDVFGEEIDLAATIGHHRGIALTERVHAEIESRYQTRALPDLKVKWQAVPLKIWEVVE